MGARTTFAIDIDFTVRQTIGYAASYLKFGRIFFREGDGVHWWHVLRVGPVLLLHAPVAEVRGALWGSVGGADGGFDDDVGGYD